MIWATGDCHGNFERFRPEYFPEQAQMTKDDVVVVTGDFGGIWFGDARDDEALGCLESLPFTLCLLYTSCKSKFIASVSSEESS